MEALQGDKFFREVWGDRFIDYMVSMKRSEVGRYRLMWRNGPLLKSTGLMYRVGAA